MYHIKCNKCGYETDMRYDCIGKATDCKHLTLGGTYISRTFQWSNPRIQHIFSGMKKRCYDTTERAYRWYGAKGIKVCDEWLSNPKSFEEWALANGYNDNLTINRKNENEDYCPENCEWITFKDNARYKSTTHLITVNGIVKTGREWSKTLNLGANTINTYMREYGEEITKQLIIARLNDKNMQSTYRPSHHTWLDVYNIH